MGAERFWMSIAWALPRKLAYWCALRVWAHGTQGKWSNQIVPELTCAEAIKRWGY